MRGVSWWSNRFKSLGADAGIAITLPCNPRSGQLSWQGSSSIGYTAVLEHMCEQGHLDKALEGFLRMDHQGVVPSVDMYKCLLRACTKRRALDQAKLVHAHLLHHDLESASSLGDDVVSTLVKCGSLEDALQVFDRLPRRNVFCWTAVISGYTDAGEGREALSMYNRMRDEGVQPNAYTFVSLLKACGRIPDLDEGKRIHAETLRYKFEDDLFVCNCLVDMYGKCGSIADAQNVFDALIDKDVVSWNVMLAAYAQEGQAEKALQLYDQMQAECVSANVRTFVSVLQACGTAAEKQAVFVADGRSTKPNSLKHGKSIHAEARRKCCDSSVFVGNTLVRMYGKCTSIMDARCVFDRLPDRNLVSWNAMLAAYVEEGQGENSFHLYEQMLQEGVTPDIRTFVSMLQACGMVGEKEQETVVHGQRLKVKYFANVREIHSDACSRGHSLGVFVGSILVAMYGSCGSTVDAHNVFCGLSERDVVSWNALLAVYLQQGQTDKALQLFEKMQEEGVSPTDQTCNILVTIHGKSGNVVEAQRIFDSLDQRDVVSWNAMLAAFTDNSQAEKALELYRKMQERDVSPDARTFVGVLQACGMLADKEENNIVDGQSTKLKSFEQGKAVHTEVKSRGYESDQFVGSTLISMYGKYGDIAGARDVFQHLSSRNVVSWTVMLEAYVRQGYTEEALQLYRRMQQEGPSPDEISLVWVLQACSNTGSLAVLSKVHMSLVSSGRDWSLFWSNSLISAYGRCSSMADAQALFDALPQPDVVSWNALIAGYSRSGDYAASRLCYEKMELAGVNPNTITLISLLSACSHAGLVDEGVEYFESMSKHHDITPEVDHYVCMMDLFGRAGLFTRIEELLSAMPMQPNLAIWLSLLGACQKHGNLTIAEQAFEHAVLLQPKDAAAYILMSNIYADAGLLDSASKIQKLRQGGGAWKKPGQTWIEHEQEIRSFLAGDCKNPQHTELYELLRKFASSARSEVLH